MSVALLSVSLGQRRGEQGWLRLPSESCGPTASGKGLRNGSHAGFLGVYTEVEQSQTPALGSAS